MIKSPPGNVAYNLSLTLDGQGLNYGPCRFYFSYYLRNLVLGGLKFKAMLDHTIISLWHKSAGEKRYRYPIGTPIRIEAQVKICHGQAFIEQIRSTLLFMGMLDRAYRTFLHISFSYFHGNSKMIGF